MCTLAKINRISHDTFVYKYTFKPEHLKIGTPPGRHMRIEYLLPKILNIRETIPTHDEPEGEFISRVYTAISSVD